MPALSTSYLRRKVAPPPPPPPHKQLSENKKTKRHPKNDYLEAYPFTVAAISREEVLGPKAKTKTQNEKANSKRQPKSGSLHSTSYY